jgi:hypothetical protein
LATAFPKGGVSLTTEEDGFETPIIFIVFSRPDTTQRVFDRIAGVKPKRLLIVADGPRAAREGERERCEEVRRIATSVTWKCNVQTYFAPENMGCRNRVISGLNWAFDQVEEAIILEDDILPDLTFFRYCGEMLERFRGDARVSMISGFNVVADKAEWPYSYFYSELTHIWGWATWRDAWKHFDPVMSAWPEVLRSGMFAEFFLEKSAQKHWIPIMQKMYDGTGKWDTWDYQWMFTNVVRRSLSVVPAVNLIQNIGYGVGGTHLANPRGAPKVSIRSLEFPLRHPPAMIASRSTDLLDAKIGNWHRYSFPRRAFRKLLRMARGR